MTPPSSILSRAADLIRDTAKAAGAEHDCLKESCGGYADYRGHCGGCCTCLSGCLYEEPDITKGSWLDLMRPPVGLMLADWIEAEAACIASVDDVQRIMPKILDGITPGAGDEDTTITVTVDTSGPALALARHVIAVLGEEEE